MLFMHTYYVLNKIQLRKLAYNIVMKSRLSCTLTLHGSSCLLVIGIIDNSSIETRSETRAYIILRDSESNNFPYLYDL